MHDSRCEATRARIYRTQPAACACQDRADGYETWQPTGGHMTIAWGESTGPAPNELPEMAEPFGRLEG